MNAFAFNILKRGSSEFKDKSDQSGIVFADEVSCLSDPIDDFVFDRCFTRARAQLFEDLSKIPLLNDD